MGSGPSGMRSNLSLALADSSLTGCSALNGGASSAPTAAASPQLSIARPVIAVVSVTARPIAEASPNRSPSGAISIWEVGGGAILSNVMLASSTAAAPDAVAGAGACGDSPTAAAQRPCAPSAATAAGGAPSGGALFVSNTAVALSASAVLGCSAPAGSGGGFYAWGPAASVTAVDTVFARNFAQGGGAFAAAAGARVRLSGTSQLSGNSALGSGGAALVLDSSTASLEGTAVSGNSAQYAGGAFVLGASAGLSASAGAAITASRAAVGGVAFLCSSSAPLPPFLQAGGQADVTIGANNRRGRGALGPGALLRVFAPCLRGCVDTATPVFAALCLSPWLRGSPLSFPDALTSTCPISRACPPVRSASNWGDIFADGNVSLTVTSSDAIPSGSDLSPFVVLRDGRGQLITGLPGAAITVSSDRPVLGRQVTNAYQPESALVGVTLTGRPNETYTLVFRLESSLLPTGAVTAARAVRLVPCGVLEAFNNVTSLCECVRGSQREPSGACACAAGFHLWTGPAGDAGCRACPSAGATCIGGLLAPAEGWWHSRRAPWRGGGAGVPVMAVFVSRASIACCTSQSMATDFETFSFSSLSRRRPPLAPAPKARTCSRASPARRARAPKAPSREPRPSLPGSGTPCAAPPPGSRRRPASSSPRGASTWRRTARLSAPRGTRAYCAPSAAPGGGGCEWWSVSAVRASSKTRGRSRASWA